MPNFVLALVTAAVIVVGVAPSRADVLDTRHGPIVGIGAGHRHHLRPVVAVAPKRDHGYQHRRGPNGDRVHAE